MEEDSTAEAAVAAEAATAAAVAVASDFSNPKAMARGDCLTIGAVSSFTSPFLFPDVLRQPFWFCLLYGYARERSRPYYIYVRAYLSSFLIRRGGSYCSDMADRTRSGAGKSMYFSIVLGCK